MSEQKRKIGFTVACVNEFANKYDLSIKEAFQYLFRYNSEIFEKLVDKETGLYLESPEYVYDLFKDEMNFGHIIQVEI